MAKTPFVTKEKVEEIVKSIPTPFHLYDEKGIRANAQAVKEAFAWNPGFREYLAGVWMWDRLFFPDRTHAQQRIGIFRGRDHVFFQ